MSSKEKWTVIYVPLNEATEMHRVHYTWGSPFVLEALVAADPFKHYVLWDHDAAPTVLYEVDELRELLTQSSMVNWSTGARADASDIAVIGIAERCSPVNAGIVFFRKENFPRFHTVATCSEEISRRVIERRKYLVVEALAHRFIAPADAHPLALEARWVAETLNAPFQGTPLHMMQANSAPDFIAIWAILGSVMNQIGFPTQDGKFTKLASLGSLEPLIDQMFPNVAAWAGIMFEQGSLATLVAFQTPRAQIRYLPGDLGFMVRDLPAVHVCQSSTRLDLPTVRQLPPINVHGYGAKGKRGLHMLETRLSSGLTLDKRWLPMGSYLASCNMQTLNMITIFLFLRDTESCYTSTCLPLVQLCCPLSPVNGNKRRRLGFIHPFNLQCRRWP